MSKMTDFILQVDEAPNNDERWAEYKKKLIEYYDQIIEEDSDWWIAQDKELKGEDQPPF